MPLRRSARLLAAAGALLLAAPVLASCGFDYATDRTYTPAGGVNDRDAKVDVLGAVVVSAQEGSGTFIATFANNSVDDTATVESIEGTGDDSALEVTGVNDLEIPAGGMVNLADEDKPVVVKGDVKAGAFVSLKVSFGSGESVTVKVPTVADCFEWAGLDKSGNGTPEDECGAGETESPEE